MFVGLSAGEITLTARLLEREQVPADTVVNFFRSPTAVVAEWLEDSPATPPVNKKWRHFNVLTGQEISEGKR